MKTALLAVVLSAAISPGVFAHEGEHHSDPAGSPGNPAKVSRTIDVTMGDNMRFAPASIKVKRGETVKFDVRNSGRLKHEMVIGTLKELKAHAEMMRMMPGMEHHDANMVTVEPGKTGEIVWRFDRAGTFDFACLVPGHFEAGMRGEIVVDNPVRRTK